METIVNETTNYAVNSIQNEIDRKVFWMFAKFGFAALVGVGISQRDLKQIRAFLVAIFSISGILGIIDLFQIMTSLLPQSLP